MKKYHGKISGMAPAAREEVSARLTPASPRAGAKSRNRPAGRRSSGAMKSILCSSQAIESDFTLVFARKGADPKLNSGEMRTSWSKAQVGLLTGGAGPAAVRSGTPCPRVTNDRSCARLAWWGRVNRPQELLLFAIRYQSEHTCAKYFLFST